MLTSWRHAAKPHQPRGIGDVKWVVVGIPIQINTPLKPDRIRAGKPPYIGIIHPRVHVDQTQAIQVFVPGVAVVGGLRGDRRSGVEAVGLAAFAPGVVA